MNTAPQPTVDPIVTQTTATVTAAADGRYVLRTATQALTARRATSCLIEPRPGDTVLVALADTTYVLAVLERQQSGEPVRLHLGGDAEIALDGELSVVAKKGMRFATGAAMSLLSSRLDVRTLDAGLALERVSLVGNYVQAEVSRVRAVAKTLDTIAERVSQRVKRSFRQVEEIDQTRAGRVDIRAQRTMTVHADNTVMTAKKLVKVDGEQIVMG